MESKVIHYERNNRSVTVKELFLKQLKQHTSTTFCIAIVPSTMLMLLPPINPRLKNVAG